MRSRLALGLQLAGLALTGWILWGARLAPRWRMLSVFDLVMSTMAYALAACAAGAAITLVLYFSARQWEGEDVLRATLRTSRVAIWFAPAVILFTALSPAALAAAAVLVVSATRLLYHEWRVAHPAQPPPPPPAGLFASMQLPPPRFWRDAAPGLLASFSLQMGIAALLLRKPLPAGIGFAMTLALFTVLTLAARGASPRPPEPLPRTLLGVLLTLVLAVGLTVGGMLPGFLHGDGSGFGFGGGGGASAASAPAPKQGTGTTNRPDAPKFTEPSFADGGFPGVILWPEVKPYATLIEPMPQRADGLGTVETRPMSIPFSGEYWMYRWPYARPPQSSYFQRGSPANLAFKTTDHRSLKMEARHKLDQAIAMDCCSRIDLAILNADRFPDTIALELLLIDNERPEAPLVSLGSQMVTSRPDVKQDPVQPVGETLSYAMPAAAPIAAFDEFQIVYLRDRRRMDQSAKVAVDRFILIPRVSVIR